MSDFIPAFGETLPLTSILTDLQRQQFLQMTRMLTVPGPLLLEPPLVITGFADKEDQPEKRGDK